MHGNIAGTIAALHLAAVAGAAQARQRQAAAQAHRAAHRARTDSISADADFHTLLAAYHRLEAENAELRERAEALDAENLDLSIRLGKLAVRA